MRPADHERNDILPTFSATRHERWLVWAGLVRRPLARLRYEIGS